MDFSHHDSRNFWIALFIQYCIPPLIGILSICITVGPKKGLHLVGKYPFWVLISMFTYFTVGGVHCGQSNFLKISIRWSFFNMVISICGGGFAIWAGTHSGGGGHHEENGIDLNALSVGVVLAIALILHSMIFYFRLMKPYTIYVVDTSYVLCQVLILSLFPSGPDSSSAFFMPAETMRGIGSMSGNGTR